MLRLALVLLTSIYFLSNVSVASASLVNVHYEGDVEWNVLPATDDFTSPKPDSLLVTNIAPDNNQPKTAQVRLDNSEGKVTLTVNDGMQTKQADVTGYEAEIIEIEQQASPSKITILSSDGGFLIREDNVSAHTSFPITIDPEERRIVIETNSGKHFIGVLPSAALTQLVNSQVIDSLGEDNIVINQSETGELEYAVPGKKILGILNLFDYEVSVTAKVSAINGKIINVEQPVWLPIASFLFS